MGRLVSTGWLQNWLHQHGWYTPPDPGDYYRDVRWARPARGGTNGDILFVDVDGERAHQELDFVIEDLRAQTKSIPDAAYLADQLESDYEQDPNAR